MHLFYWIFSASLHPEGGTVPNLFSMLKTLSKPKPTTFKAQGNHFHNPN